MLALKRKFEDALYADEDKAPRGLTAVTRFLNGHFKAFQAHEMALACAGKGKYKDFPNASNVLDEWERRRVLGKEVHNMIEDFLVSPAEFKEDPEEFHCSAEWICFHQFRRWFASKGFKHWMSEYKVYDLKGHLVGVIDLVVWNEDGQVTVVDLKVKDDLSDEPFGDAKGIKAPCDVLHDSNLVKASLQVHLYAQMLKLRHKDLPPVNTLLLQLYPTLKEAQEVQPLPLEQYALKMISQARLSHTIQATKRRKRW